MAGGLVQRILSGGQTGVDQAALRAAVAAGLATGGYVPKGRLAEDGPISAEFTGLEETDSPAPELRTRLNVTAADATLILLQGKPDAGTALTSDIAATLGRPLLILDLRDTATPAGLQRGLARLHRFLAENGVQVLNVAGPRESNAPGIGARAASFLSQALTKGFSGPTPVPALSPDEKLVHLESGLTSLRHWDSIRWLVPFWYLTAAGTAATEIDRLSPLASVVLGLGLMLAGLAALHLVGRTIVYNNDQITRLRAIGAAVDLHRIGTIRFAWSGGKTPATLVFMALMALATAAWAIWSLRQVMALAFAC